MLDEAKRNITNRAVRKLKHERLPLKRSSPGSGFEIGLIERNV
jgi:hypothetical protein